MGYSSLYRLLWLIIPTIIFVLCTTQNVNAQLADKYQSQKTRILFLLDGSGSMNERWDGKSKFEISKKLLSELIDSIQKADPTVEFGIRVFGHQSPRDDRNCKDTKLEVPFGQNNAPIIQTQLAKVTPQGWTPIAYSIFRAAEDFPKEPGIKNALIIITDGLETCDGDPCAAGRLLQDKRIALRPFIIGLGLGIDKKDYFDCVGTYFDVSSEEGFEEVLEIVVSQSLNTTTSQINLLNDLGKPAETDIEISMYDHHSKMLLYNFVHALNDDGWPDTLYLDPVGKYDVIAHTVPSVYISSVELAPGIHNIIPMNTPQGTLSIKENSPLLNKSNIQCIIRLSGNNKTITTQELNSQFKYLTGSYDVEILTLPRIIHSNVNIEQGKTTDITVNQPGTLNIVSARGGILGVFQRKGENMDRVYEFNPLRPKQRLELQPGKYVAIYRANDNKNANLTQMKDFEIQSGGITTLRY